VAEVPVDCASRVVSAFTAVSRSLARESTCFCAASVACCPASTPLMLVWQSVSAACAAASCCAGVEVVEVASMVAARNGAQAGVDVLMSASVAASDAVSVAYAASSFFCAAVTAAAAAVIAGLLVLPLDALPPEAPPLEFPALEFPVLEPAPPVDPVDVDPLLVEVELCDARSDASVCSAWVTVWVADVMAEVRLVESRVASVSPALTVSPTATATLPTVPAVWKARSFRETDATVPVVSTVSVTAPMEATAVR